MDQIKLSGGSHPTREDGMCAMEFVAWVANEEHSDDPACVDRDLARLLRSINDKLDGPTRQGLKPYLGRCIGTSNDGREADRQVVLDRLVKEANGDLIFTCGCDLCIAQLLADRGWLAVAAALDELLPTVELPEVTAAIREKVGAEA